MKAISLWQPWASAMARGDKHNETRSWPISHRGDLLICSAKRKPTPEETGPENYDAAMKLPYGFALCIVEVFDCRGVEWIASQAAFSEREREWGDYTAGIGRYAWMTRNLRTFTRPFPIRGSQGLFTVPDEVIERETLMPVKTGNLYLL
jgi:activating signal cointegrator 1